MSDQATQLRQLVRTAAAGESALASPALTVVVSGACPGAGVTTLVTALARELTQLGKRVALVDANITRPRLAAEFGLRPRSTLADLLAGSRSAAESFTQTTGGILVLAGAVANETVSVGGVACERLAAELRVVARQAQVILIDAGAGMNPWVDRLWRLASQVLLATEPDPAAVLDAYAMVKQSQFHRLDRRVRLAINGFDAFTDVDGLDDRFVDTCRRFLCIEPRRAVAIPRREEVAVQEATAPQDDSFARSVRLMAADLACEIPTSPHHSRHPEVRRGVRSAHSPPDSSADLGVTRALAAAR